MKIKFLLSIFIIFNFMASAQELKIVVPSDVYRDYERFIAGRNPNKIDDYEGEYSRRDVVEVVLAVKALNRGGIDLPIKITHADSYSRTLAEIEKGNYAISGTTVWKSDTDDTHFFISNETLKDGEFFAGLYANVDNKSFFEINNKQDLRKFKAVSNSSWTSDWGVLNNMSLNSLQDVKQFEQMVRMVKYKRVDFLLAPFQTNPEMTLKTQGITLYPLWGYKVALPGSRVFIISKKYPGAIKIYKSFNKGLDELIRSGEVKKAYEQSGFINKKTLKWEVIN